MNRRAERTFQLVRGDGRHVRTISLRGWRFGITVAGGALGLMAIGVLASWVLGVTRESSRIAQLERENEGLRAERAQVFELAGRLSQLEQGVGVLRSVVTEGRPEVEVPPNVAMRRLSAMTARPDVERERPAWPLAQGGFITRRYGSRPATSPVGHAGLDIAAPTGSYVRAIQGGWVEEAGDDPVYGKVVRIAHGNGLTSLYGHNSWLFAAVGDTVERLEVIALTGSTGRSSAPHLHLELSRNGSLVDPLTIITHHGSRSETAFSRGGHPTQVGGIR